MMHASDDTPDSGLHTLHHIGFACADIESGLRFIERVYSVTGISECVFDPSQQATLCLVETRNGQAIELVAGPVVAGLVERGVTLYHLAYSVEDIHAAIRTLSSAGARQVRKVLPAKLFNGAQVCFLQTPLGLVELVEQAKQENGCCLSSKASALGQSREGSGRQ